MPDHVTDSQRLSWTSFEAWCSNCIQTFYHGIPFLQPQHWPDRYIMRRFKHNNVVSRGEISNFNMLFAYLHAVTLTAGVD